MSSRARELGRLCWPALRPVVRCIADGMAGVGMAYGAVPPAALWAINGESGWTRDTERVCAGATTSLSRRERRQWAQLTRQLQ
jgi:hypothetical protein